MHRVLRKLLAVSLALVPLVTTSAASAAETSTRILTSPPRILASVAPGASSTATLLVANQSRSPARLTIRASDLAPDPEGSRFGVLVDVGDAPRGAGAWLAIEQTALTLRGGERRSVPIRIAVPTDASGGGYYGAVVVESATDEDAPDIDVRVRLVTHVNVLVPGNVGYAGRIDDLEVRHLGDGRLRVRGTWENTGNVQSTPRDAVVRVDGPFDSSRRATLEVPESMPGGRREFERTVRIPFPAGRFHVRVTGTLEDRSTVRAAAAPSIAWRSWVPLAGAGAVVVLLLLVLVPVIRRRREFRRLVDAELERLDESPEDDDPGT